MIPIFIEDKKSRGWNIEIYNGAPKYFNPSKSIEEDLKDILPCILFDFDGKPHLSRFEFLRLNEEDFDVTISRYGYINVTMKRSGYTLKQIKNSHEMYSACAYHIKKRGI